MPLDQLQFKRLKDTLDKTRSQVSQLPVSDAYPAAPTAALWHTLVNLQGALQLAAVEIGRGAIASDSNGKLRNDADEALTLAWGDNLSRYRAAILSAEKGEQPVTERAKGPARAGSVVLPDDKFRQGLLNVLDALQDYAMTVYQLDLFTDYDQSTLYKALDGVNTFLRDMGNGSVTIVKDMANVVTNAAGDVAANVAKQPGKVLSAGLGAMPWKEIGIALVATGAVAALIHFWPKKQKPAPQRRAVAA